MGTAPFVPIANGHGREADLPFGLEPDPNDEVNPNWEAPPTGTRQSGSRKGKERAIENEGCLYCVKPRRVFVVVSFMLSLTYRSLVHS